MSEQIQGIANSELFSNDITELQANQTNQTIVNANYPIIVKSMPFPPVIEPKDLIINKKSLQDNPNGKQIRAPNAFIIYRKAFVKAARDQGYVLPMTAISSMASASWDQETEQVKEEYKKIAKETHKLIKEMFPKKPNQRKRKEKWNLVSFQNKSLNNDNNVIKTNLFEDNNSSGEGFENVIISTEESKATNEYENNMLTTQYLSLLTPVHTPNLITSSPNLSEIDDGSISEENYINNYLVDASLPNSFREYLFTCLPEEGNQPGNNLLWSNPLENYSFDIPPSISADDLNEYDKSKYSLNMTLAEVENFDLGFDIREYVY